MLGQIAKIKSCRTVAIAGGAAKIALCHDAFGYDAAIDYKQDDLDSALKAASPGGVDVYFDNTAGAISDAVLKHLNVGARV
ncbi:zinc-binding dehydrogenase [Reyranella sp.]|uniref:zinc-binding dehydrogenase n=1 Tax=Reyranella sp. TaxID=1929291 RepID=UPI0039C9D15A